MRDVNSAETAIAIFTSIPSDDEVERASGKRLLDHTLNTVSDVSNVTTFVVGDPGDRDVVKNRCRDHNCQIILGTPTGRTGLRAKVQQTARDLFEDGFDYVLLLASDIPNLNQGDIESALDELRTSPGKAVVGPSPDGGFNYLGLGDWHGPILKNVPFFTERTRQYLLDRLRTLNYQVVVQDFRRDIDELHQWLTVSESIVKSTFQWIIRRILNVVRQWTNGRAYPQFVSGSFGSVSRTRAPPVYHSS